MQVETTNSEHSSRSGRQVGPPRQAQREIPRLSIRRSFSTEASSRRKKIFCLCILCWFIVLCLTGIIVIAVVHFQSSSSRIDQISAGALIGFGLLLIVVLGWTAILYNRFQKSSSITRQDSRAYPPREEMLAFASSDLFGGRGVSTISTDNSASHSDSSSDGTSRRFISRERHYDDERRVIDPVNTRYITDAPITVFHPSNRMVRHYRDRVPGVARPQHLHFPERSRLAIEAPRFYIDRSRGTRHVRTHSNPLPPPYQPPVPTRPLSESLPMGFPPPAYERVIGRMRRFDSTVSEESNLYPPDYQSSPPSPLSLQTVTNTGRRSSLNLPSDRTTESRASLNVSATDRPASIDVGIQISSSISAPVERSVFVDSPSQSYDQPPPSPSPGISTGEYAIDPSFCRLSPGAQASPSSYFTPQRYRSASPRLHSPNPPLHSTARVTESSENDAQAAQAFAPVFLKNNRSPFSRPILSLTSPENTIQESVDNEEESAFESVTETPNSPNQVDQPRPNVVLVYLAQSQEEEIIV